MKGDRPLSVTLLACAVLIVAAFNLARFFQAVWQWSFLVQVLPFSPVYLAMSGLVWGIAGVALGFGMWRGCRWARSAFFFAWQRTAYTSGRIAFCFHPILVGMLIGLLLPLPT
jgi:hypothetical protein